MQHTLGSAARMAGLSKSTLSRGIKDGKLSAIRSDDTGSYKIEQSELERYLAAVAIVRATAENRATLQAATQQEHRDFAVPQFLLDRELFARELERERRLAMVYLMLGRTS